MSVPPNVWNPSQILASQLALVDMYEKRIEYDANSNPIYVFYTPVANAPESSKVWFGFKYTYDSEENAIRVQLPDDGFKWCYSYTDRATYFS